MVLSSYWTRGMTRMLTPKFPSVFGASLRYASGREDCSTEPEPRCSPEALALTDCMKDKQKRKKEMKKKYLSPFRHLIVDERCCPPRCPELPRFDDMYYKESDKLTRIYQRTWAECPECLFRPKKVCCRPKDPLPPIVRRPRKTPPPETACVPKKICKKGGRPKKCPTFTLKCCKKARVPPKCLGPQKERVICRKRCTPFPSFSECVKPNFRIPRPVECFCLRIPPQCVIYAEMKKKESKGKN